MIRRRRDYRVDLSRDGTLVTDRGRPLDAPPAWTPEHLVLAALARCTLLALEYHARRASLSAAVSASAAGEVGERDDGTWGFVGLACSLDVSLDPAPDPANLAALLEHAERGCFVGASLTPKPTYHWRVNGEDLR